MKEEIFYLPTQSKLYCEKISPNHQKFDQPIILIHGGGHTGSCYKTTPDERSGWAYYFAEKGFEVYVPDWSGCGRSGYVSDEILTGQFVVDGFLELIKKIDKKVIILTHSMSGAYGWKLGELANKKITHLIAVAPAPMGNIQPLPEIIEEMSDGIVLNYLQKATKISTIKPFICDDYFIIKKLIGEKNKFFPSNCLEAYKSSIQSIPPMLIYERFNIKKSQLKIEDVTKYKNINVLVITGDQDTDHPKEKDQQIVDYFMSNKINTDYYYLGDQNIKGNGHMLMLEKNSSEIADVIYNWILNK